MLRILGARLVHAYSTVPTWGQWIEVVLLFGLFVVIALPAGVARGLLTLRLARQSVGSLVVFAAVALVVPSLFEETLYRALLLPHPSERRSDLWLVLSVIVGVVLFVLGHPLVAWLWAPASRPLAYHPVF